MQNYVKIKSGTYRSSPLKDMIFPLIKPISYGKRGAFVTVDASAVMNPDYKKIRVLVNGPLDLEPSNKEDYEKLMGIKKPKAKKKETPEQAMNRIKGRFQILDKMTDAVANNVVRGLIVSGPPGVGKSFGVEKILDEYEAMAKLGGKTRTEIVKGSMTPIGLYQTLFNNSNEGDILVFDDCDSILFDEVCLNMLKAVLDSGKKRTITWTP